MLAPTSKIKDSELALDMRARRPSLKPRYAGRACSGSYPAGYGTPAGLGNRCFSHDLNAVMPLVNWA